MKIVAVGPAQQKRITGYDATNAFSLVAASGSGRAHVHTLHFEPGGVIGRHPAGPAQLFIVVEGAGWVEGGDGVRAPITVGQAAYIAAGESHAKGSESGMSAVMVQVETLALEESR